MKSSPYNPCDSDRERPKSNPDRTSTKVLNHGSGTTILTQSKRKDHGSKRVLTPREDDQVQDDRFGSRVLKKPNGPKDEIRPSRFTGDPNRVVSGPLLSGYFSYHVLRIFGPLYTFRRCHSNRLWSTSGSTQFGTFYTLPVFPTLNPYLPPIPLYKINYKTLSSRFLFPIPMSRPVYQ